MWPWLLIQLSSDVYVPPAPTPDPVVGGGWPHRYRPPFVEDAPRNVRLSVDLAFDVPEFSAVLHLVPANAQLRVRLLNIAPDVSAEVTMQPATMRLQALLELEAMRVAAQLHARGRKKGS